MTFLQTIERRHRIQPARPRRRTLEEGPQLRNLYGRRGNIIGEELVAPRPETIGDLVALQDLRDQLNEMENRTPLTEEVEREVPLGHYLTNVDTENLEIEEEIDPNDTDRFIL